MYLRETKRRNADGSVVRYFQLAENTWDAARGCAVAKVVYNFGRADQLDRDALRRLASSILRVCEDAGARAPADDVTVRDAWPYGGVYVLELVWRQLGIDKVLGRCAKATGTNQPFERALFAMVANRALEPTRSCTAGSSGFVMRSSFRAPKGSGSSTSTARWTSSRRTRSTSRSPSTSRWRT